MATERRAGAGANWSALPITQGDKLLGELRWQPEAQPPHPHLMQAWPTCWGAASTSTGRKSSTNICC
ncbi:hypothetical protein M8494_02960 [Serratia ureilytica]